MPSFICDLCENPYKTAAGLANHKKKIHYRPRRARCKEQYVRVIHTVPFTGEAYELYGCLLTKGWCVPSKCPNKGIEKGGD